MTGGRQKRLGRTPAPAVSLSPWRARGAVLLACGAMLLATTTPAFAQARSNKNVRTWAWADEVVQPGSNVIAKKSKQSSPSREVVRQLLAQARIAADRGKLDVAEQLAQRADVLLKANLVAGPEGWDPADQTPDSFLMQLATFRAQQSKLQNTKSPSLKRAPEAVAESHIAPAPAPPALDTHDPESVADTINDDFPGPVKRTKRGARAQRGSLGGSEDFGLDQPLDAKPDSMTLLRKPVSAGTASPLVVESDANQEKLDGELEMAAEHAPQLATAAPLPPVTERIIQIHAAPEQAPHSMFADAMVQLLSTAAGLVLGILLLVGVRTFIKRRYNADFGFVFRVEHVATGEDGMYLPYTYFPGMQPSEPLPMPTAGPGRNGAAAVLTELPAGFQSDELSPYEEQLRAQEEAESEMMKMVLQQNLELREELSGRANIAA